MNIITAFPRSPHDDHPGFPSRKHDRLRVAAAILDGVSLSALLWLAILLMVN